MKSNSNKPRKPGRVGKNYFVTKSGTTIKLHRSLTDRLKSSKNTRSMRKAAALSTLPKGQVKRVFARLGPKRLYKYWFSRDGAIMALKLLGIGMVAGFLLLVGLFSYFRKDLPNLKDISGTNLGGSISYYDRTGQTLLWQDYAAVKRTPVSQDKISQYMKDATVAIEDKDFFKHGGFDVRGIARAGINDAFGSGGTQGGSTITQQVVKLNQNWTRDRSLTRKVKELILAVELEREYTKSEILTGYLNVAPYGGVEYGVETAARDYFGVSAKDLTLAQASMLASIPKAPTAYSPFSDPLYNPGATASLFDQPALISRQQYVLDQMASQGKITKVQAEAAKKVDIIAQVHQLQPLYNGIKAPYFVQAAKQELNQKYGEATTKRGGWKVTTTLDLTLQDTAEGLVAKNISNAYRLTGGVADEQALVAEDVATGQIVSLVGGTDFSNAEHGKINYAASALIPPGSSFKPYDYTTFIDNNNNVGAGSVLFDQQGALPGYPCTNKAQPKQGGNCLQDYDFKYPGPMTLRYALGGSRNVPAVKAMLSAVPNDTSDGKVNSINKVISTASAMMANPYNPKPYQCYKDGVDINNATSADVSQCYGASAIGDGAFLHLDDHVNGLSTLARLGNAIPRTYILKITDSANKTVSQWTQPKGKQVVKADSAYIVNDMASDPNSSYLPSSYKFQNQKNGWKFAVKTGTTNNGFDGLMTSWSTKYAVVTWAGNHTRNKELHTAMEYLTTPLARGWMEAAHANIKAVNWVAPNGLKTLPAFVVRTHVGIGSVEPSRATDLFPSWYQGKTAGASNQTIDKVSKKTATSCTPPAAKDNQANANANSFSVDIFVNGSGAANTGSTATSGNDDVHNCDDAKPSITVTATLCDIVATVSQGTHPLSSSDFTGNITFTVNGQSVSSSNVSDSPSSASYTAAPGTTSVSVVVSDSVLYTASASTDVNCAAAVSAVPLGSVHYGGGNYSWSGGTGNVTIYKYPATVLCSSKPASVGICSGGTPPSGSWYGQDETGVHSPGTT
ncbi:MAG: transglycosylase domain-containing protein [Candidatus Saccharibacteria bacterium]